MGCLGNERTAPCIETDVSVTSSDKVLTLSTCTPGGASRFIVMAKLDGSKQLNKLKNGAGAYAPAPAI